MVYSKVAKEEYLIFKKNDTFIKNKNNEKFHFLKNDIRHFTSIFNLSQKRFCQFKY
jgi:hypothetical protein